MLCSCDRALRVALVAAFALAPIARGQNAPTLQLADRGPRFLSPPTATSPSVDVSDAPVFKRRVTLELNRVPLRAALREITKQTGVRFEFVSGVVPLGAPVSLSVSDLTVGAVLYELLLDANVDVHLIQNDLLTLVPRIAPNARGRGGQQASGTISGRVVDSNTGAPVAQAIVIVEATSARARTALDGRYVIREVPNGTWNLMARALGYSAVTRRVTVGADSTAHVDFSLTRSAQALDEVVTTVTGNEKRYQVGNLIETVRADSVMKAAPATNLGDLLNARVPGVQVFEPGGQTGASPTISIRGQNSITALNQPLLYIDGVRVENNAATSAYGSSANPITTVTYGSALSGRLNDLNPDEIESIEVVKGPSAATLYGTDAANGVILVTTKRGGAGAPRWDLMAEAGALTMDRSRFLSGYRAWGHTTDGTNTLEQCTLVMKAAGSCVIDSVTHFSPLQDPATTIVSTGSRQQYGAQVSGGAQQTRYFASGTYEGEAAPIKMPTPDRAILAAERGAAGLEPDNIRPNALRKASGRLNLTAALGPRADVTFSSGLLSRESRIPTAFIFAWGQVTPGYRDANDGWGLGIRPAKDYALRNREDVTHVTGGASSNWHPTDWIVGRATTGIDYSSSYLDELDRPNEVFAGDPGLRMNGRVNVALYTVDLGVTATTHPLADVSSKTSAGGQYNHRSELDNAATAINLAPGTVSVAGGGVQTATEANIESIVTGGYAEQTLGLNERLFLTGGVRADGSSSFGQNFHAALYPKMSASWLVSQEPWMPKIPLMSSIRLRAAYGSSGVQPGATDALMTISLAPAVVDGGIATTGGLLSSLGNTRLRPERQTELEAGADLDALDQRVQLGVTYYNKKSTDALFNEPVVNQLGISSGTQEINVGSVRNRGYEVSASVELIRSQPLDWRVGLNASNNQNRLLKLAPGVSSTGGGFATLRVGYPVSGAFDRPILDFQDTDHDGLVTPSEVTVGTTSTYLGNRFPTAQLTAQTALGLWRDVIQLNVQVDSRSGGVLTNGVAFYQALFQWARAENDPSASLRSQAIAVATRYDGTFAGLYQNGSFTRLREVSLTYNAPAHVSRWIHGRTMSLTIAGRNLVLWTRYGGADPEVNGVPSGGMFLRPYSDFGATPMTRYWIGRVRIGL